MSMSVYIFNVGRGNCVAIITPNNKLIMIDCGSDASLNYSPADLFNICSGFINKSDGLILSKLIITHPHEDHISDIENISRLTPPYLYFIRRDIDWPSILANNSNSSTLSYLYNNYILPQPVYPQISEIPDWGDGFDMRHYYLNDGTAKAKSKTISSYINNTSIITVINYKTYKFVFTGDIEEEGMKALLDIDVAYRTNIWSYKNLFGYPTGGVDFFMTPHHGHRSGFSSTWFSWTGPTKIFNIASERRSKSGEDPSRTAVDSRYSAEAYSMARNREGRRMISTKSDGNIRITIDDHGKWNWGTF